jgi:hypothetical protein
MEKYANIIKTHGIYETISGDVRGKIVFTLTRKLSGFGECVELHLLGEGIFDWIVVGIVGK